MTKKHRNSRISPISLRTGKNPKPKSKSLGRVPNPVISHPEQTMLHIEVKEEEVVAQ
jgi:hypothetical protein